jgi:hypothetical protein
MEAYMRAKVSRTVPFAAAAVLALTVTPAATAATGQVHDPVPITPNQLFSGYVNGSNVSPVAIKVACAVGATTGHPIGKQPVEVEPTVPIEPPGDEGNTGANGTSIVATLVTPSAAGTSHGHVATFTSFYVPKNIPTKLTVPCSGSGIMAFTPKPTGSGAVTAKLKVTFGNVTS